MSCPYLERGRIALCRAVGKRGMELNPEGMETDCFSGDFSLCSLLLFPAHRERRTLRPATLRKKGLEKGGSLYGGKNVLPAP
jgi:hypothetical protein